MPKLLFSGTILTAAVVAALAVGAAARPDGSQVSSAQDAANRAGFAPTESAATNVSAPAGAAAAGQPSVVITSFIIADNNNHVAEICGHVTGTGTDYSIVRVSVDPGEKNPGIYNTLAGGDGAFCAAVVTFTGRADASVKGMNKPVSATAGHNGR